MTHFDAVLHVLIILSPILNTGGFISALGLLFGDF